MGVDKAYKHRIYPNDNQKKYFSKVFGCLRSLYNEMLSDKKDYYEKINKILLPIQVNIKKNFYP
ncbi:helix-turn-helix domain-containing protein [Borreliella burgdorferi]|uniref:Transposase, IS605 family n=1 Tax=Borreliella burgdorferi 118a TaxID=476210 RepID=A0A7U3YB83_BORBG|nr:helix-turn-helix domain-containing protein [Borreliella burgdorferi]ACL34048.1 putative transposase [Borreliella burgdorferi 156a]ACN92820.1 transposase, IS605 family [Borreliella burgdorferi 118a]MCD2379139.1 helix-turn-helix domain-containing protein [Borreliella burgdorferi]MCD2391134.1 helix-turn-helix domain-containing protein [Borreliella burgdorferi]MDK7383702.1 helix-turn-helix domain-containing protein [Borreliella burgdorferi]